MQIQAHRPRWIPLAVLLSVGTLPATASESAALPAPAGEGMRVGASVVDISPKQLPAIVSGGFFEDRADRVADPLRVRSLVLDDGRVRVAIAIVDSLILQAIRIGELALVAIPAEVFGITGLKIKARSPLAATFVLELANGAEGYIPPPEQHRLGGYTTWPARTACLDENAEPAIVEAVLCLLEEVSGKRRRTEEPPPCAYGRAVLASGPLAWWRLEELEGIRAADAGGRGNHGSFEGNLAFSLEGPDLPGLRDGARPGRAVHLAGGDLRADLPIPGSAWTVELWFWNGLPADARSETGVLACLGPAGGAPPSVVLSIGGKERAQGKLLLSAPGAGPVGGATEIGLRTWHHVALRSDGARISVLLDGRAEPEISAAATAAGGDLTVRIGGRGPGDPGAFEGRIDEAAIYGRALGADEVSTHALAAVSP